MATSTAYGGLFVDIVGSIAHSVGALRTLLDQNEMNTADSIRIERTEKRGISKAIVSLKGRVKYLKPQEKIILLETLDAAMGVVTRLPVCKSNLNRGITKAIRTLRGKCQP